MKIEGLTVEHITVSELSRGVFNRVVVRIGNDVRYFDAEAAADYQRRYAEHLFERPDLDLEEIEHYTAARVLNFTPEQMSNAQDSRLSSSRSIGSTIRGLFHRRRHHASNARQEAGISPASVGAQL